MNVVDMNEARLRKADEQFAQRMVISSVFVPRMMSRLPEVRKAVEADAAIFKADVLAQERRRAKLDAEVQS